MSLPKRCPYCGELWFSDLTTGEQYRCGTVLNADTRLTVQHNYCLRLCGDARHAKVRRPAMIREDGKKVYNGSRGRWSPVRDRILLMSPGETVYFEECDRAAANRAMHLVAHKIAHKILFRHDKGMGRGCHVSMVGDVSGMQPGDCRIYSDNLKHTWTRLETLNRDARAGKPGEVYTFDEIEGVYWIRRVR